MTPGRGGRVEGRGPDGAWHLYGWVDPGQVARNWTPYGGEDRYPPFTASLDSAMSLVSGQDFGAGSKDATGKAWAWVGAFDGPDHISNAATPALALVAAALRARAAL